MTSAVFRLDASTRIGSGHAVRCATLAHALRRRGVDSAFVCRALPGDASAWLAAQGFTVLRLPAADDPLDQAQDAAHTRDALTARGDIDWLIVDHYGLDARWEQQMRSRAGSILVIDDLADRPHDCDMLLDQNLRPHGQSDYGARVAQRTRLLLGPKYALLRPEFAAARRQRSAERVPDGCVKRILVCFGGSDPANHTATALSALAPAGAGIERIDVVIGSANPHRAAIEALIAASLPMAVLHVQTNDIAGLLAAADLAIGAGGTMIWERACLGVPTLAFGIADNQTGGLNELIEHGYAAGTPELRRPGEIGEWIACALGNPPLLRGQARRSMTLTDGSGCDRVVDAMLPSPLTFRLATPQDCDRILAWRNAPDIRDMSLHKDEIAPSAHRAWFTAALDDPARILLIAEIAGIPAGVVRFDLAPPAASISVYRTPEAPPRCGLIQRAGDWLRENRPDIRRITAEVLADNAPSLAAFRSAGYRPAHCTLSLELEPS